MVNRWLQLLSSSTLLARFTAPTCGGLMGDPLICPRLASRLCALRAFIAQCVDERARALCGATAQRFGRARSYFGADVASRPSFTFRAVRRQLHS